MQYQLMVFGCAVKKWEENRKKQGRRSEKEKDKHEKDV